MTLIDSEYLAPPNAPLRLSDAERAVAVDALTRNASEGRLSGTELAERADLARGAVTRGDLATLFVDPPVPSAHDRGIDGWDASLVPDLPPTQAVTAAFDTRADIPEVFSGSAARGIAKRLAKQGLRPAAGPQSFLVGKTGALLEGELEHARHFGQSIAAAARHGRAVPA